MEAGLAREWVELIAGVLALLGIGWRVIRSIDRRLDQIDNSVDHGKAIVEIREDLQSLKHGQAKALRVASDVAEAIRPTNGDQRSISDRLDSVKHEVKYLKDEVTQLHGAFDEHRDDDNTNFATIHTLIRQERSS